MVSDAVRSLYERWIYPDPVFELDDRVDAESPAQRHLQYWPDGRYRQNPAIDILVAGCGTNSAARIAKTHSSARVVGIDISRPSLEHQALLKSKYALDNLSLHECEIERVTDLAGDYDFITSFGVLHHLPDPLAGLRALKEVLRPDGAIALMLYGLHGRTEVYMLREVFRMLGLQPTEADLEVVRATVASLPPEHFGQRLSRSKGLGSNAALADLLLHPQDQAFTVATCLDLVQRADLAFMGWLEPYSYKVIPEAIDNPELLAKLRALQPETLWSTLELLRGDIAQHVFCVCNPSRDPATYLPNFDDNHFLNAIPHQYAEHAMPGRDHGWIAISRGVTPAAQLSPLHAYLFAEARGNRTVWEIICDHPGDHDVTDLIEQARQCYRTLWEFGYLLFELPPRR